jgi:hypothetical protein
VLTTSTDFSPQRSTQRAHGGGKTSPCWSTTISSVQSTATRSARSPVQSRHSPNASGSLPVPSGGITAPLARNDPSSSRSFIFSLLPSRCFPLSRLLSLAPSLSRSFPLSLLLSRSFSLSLLLSLAPSLSCSFSLSLLLPFQLRALSPLPLRFFTLVSPNLDSYILTSSFLPSISLRPSFLKDCTYPHAKA